MSLHPYLFFSGTAREAMTRYQQVLGGQLEIMAFSDMPPGEEPGMEMAPDAVMHAALTLDDGSLIMASDDPTGDGGGVKGVALHLSDADLDEVRRMFDALSEGGEVQMPLEPVFWSPLFGACVDRFGVSWMLSGEAEEQG
ncbi:MAG: VOC family protein [Acidimicrobiales bacterium]|nr:VOC family protein [Acidimicrobiales bacterium]